MSERRELEASIARSLDGEPDLLPLLPELLADLDSLGGSPDDVLDLLRTADLRPGMRALDLGCGKGAVALRLAGELGLEVEAVDAFEPFLAEGRRRAAQRGLAERVTFARGEVVARAAAGGDADVVLLIALGDVLGDPRRTVAALRDCVRPGGWMVIDDAFRAEGVADDGSPPDHEAYLAALRSHGDRIVREHLPAPDEVRALERRNLQAIARRAEALGRARPELAPRLRAYVASQEREGERLVGPLVPALWLLQRTS